MGKLNLNTAEGTRVELTKKQKVQIERLYKRVSKNIAREAEGLPKTTSGSLRQHYLKELQKQVDDQLKKIGQELEGIITENMSQAARAVVDDNLGFLQSVGLPIQGAFSHVPDEVVRSLVSGKLYEGNWTLSKAIWGETEKAQKDVRTVIAEGVAQNKSAYDIAKDLEKYVNPSARKDWDWSKVYPGTNKKVDYSAQRLARTMVSHAYQQSFVKTTQKNPFVTKYRWMSSNSSRVCEICAARDGRLFDKNDLPLDHPNGMCTFEAVMEDSMVDIADRIADWVHGKDDPALDEYVKSMGLGISDKGVIKPRVTQGRSTPSGGSPSPLPKPGVKSPGSSYSNDAWIGRNLSGLKRQVQETFGPRYWTKLSDKLKTLNDEQLKWLSLGEGTCKKMIVDTRRGDYWKEGWGILSIDLKKDSKGASLVQFSNFFHEYGHLMDTKLSVNPRSGPLTATGEFGKRLYDTLKEDYGKLRGPDGHLKPEIKKALQLENRKTAGTQDIISGLSGGREKLFWGHSQEYWGRMGKDSWKEVTSEAWANLNSAYLNSEEGEQLKKFFPQSYELFEKEVKKHVGKVP